MDLYSSLKAIIWKVLVERGQAYNEILILDEIKVDSTPLKNMWLQLKFVEAKLDIIAKHASMDITAHWLAPGKISNSPLIMVSSDDKEG